MPTQQDYETAAARYMCMREDGLLSQLSEAQYVDKLKMIGITWHGPQGPAAKFETVRDYAAREELPNTASPALVAMPISYEVDAEALRHMADKGPDLKEQRMEQLREQIRRRETRGWYP
jgi:hypothetical protein